MQIRLTREYHSDQPTLELQILSEEDEREIFRELGLDQIRSSPELLQRYFSYHRELYSAVNLSQSLYDSFDSGDNQFSNACNGFGSFLKAMSNEQLDMLNDVVIQKINEEMARQDQGTITSVRTIMLSPTKRLPVATFNVEDPTMRLQIGNKVYQVNPTLLSDGTVIDNIRENAQDTVKKYREFYQQANQSVIQQIETTYKNEINRIQQQYRDQILFPNWLTHAVLRDYKIRAFFEGNKRIVYVLPFKYRLQRITQGESTYNLREDWKENKDAFIQLHASNNMIHYARIVKVNFEMLPNMHTMTRHLCMGSYKFPQEEITSGSQLAKIRDDVQEVFKTVNFNSLGSGDWWNDFHRELHKHTTTVGGMKTVCDYDNPIHIHMLGSRRDEY